jgi:hypothetical protein
VGNGNGEGESERRSRQRSRGGWIGVEERTWSIKWKLRCTVSGGGEGEEEEVESGLGRRVVGAERTQSSTTGHFNPTLKRSDGYDVGREEVEREVRGGLGEGDGLACK